MRLPEDIQMQWTRHDLVLEFNKSSKAMKGAQKDFSLSIKVTSGN